MVSKEVSIATIRREIKECEDRQYGWSFSEVDETDLTFTVSMIAKDNLKYIVHITFDNYKQWPLLIEFKDGQTGQLGVRSAYPFTSDGFFNKDKIAICHPCSRKAYATYTGLHNDWGDMAGWQNVPSISSVTTLLAALETIYYRINGENYNGKME